MPRGTQSIRRRWGDHVIVGTAAACAQCLSRARRGTRAPLGSCVASTRADGARLFCPTLELVRARALWLLAVFAASALSGANDLRTDPRLAKPISMRLKVASLTDCAKALADATGVGIFVSANIKDRKVTLIFRDRPAAEAMEMLAGTLFCRWSTDQSSYRLVMPPEVRNEETRLLDAEQAILRERLTAVIAKMVEVAGRPKDVVKDEQSRMSEAMAKLQNARDAESQKQFQAMRREYNTRYAWLNWWDTGYALRNVQGAADSLASGATVFASTRRGEALPLPASSIPSFTARVVVPGPDGQMVMETRTPTGAVEALRVDPVSGRLQSRVLATGVLPASGLTSQETGLTDSGEAETRLWNQPLRKRLREWERIIDTDLASKKLSSTAEVHTPGYLAKAFTVAEHLEHLADCAGIPVVADAFRLPASSETFFSATRVADYVSEMRNEFLQETRGGAFRADKGWLMFRHPRYWRQIDAEIPESILGPIEARAMAGYRLNLADYAAFALALTPRQALVFPYRGDLTRFPRLPLLRAMPALRLWASLTDSQRETAYSSGLPAAAMDETQKVLFRIAVGELLWVGSVNESFLPVLMNAGSGQDIGLFLQDARNGAEPMTNSDDESLQPAAPGFRTSADFENLRSRSYVFSFGRSPRSGASYSIVLARQGG